MMKPVTNYLILILNSYIIMYSISFKNALAVLDPGVSMFTKKMETGYKKMFHLK